MVTLPESDDFDSVTCACIADVDWDGCDEIILGTYGQVRLSEKTVFANFLLSLISWCSSVGTIFVVSVFVCTVF